MNRNNKTNPYDEIARSVNYREFERKLDWDTIPVDLIANVPRIMDVCPFDEYVCGCVIARYSNWDENCNGYYKYPEYPHELSVRRNCSQHNGSRIASRIHTSNTKCDELTRIIQEHTIKLQAERELCKQMEYKDRVEFDPESKLVKISTQFPWSNYAAYKELCTTYDKVED